MKKIAFTLPEILITIGIIGIIAALTIPNIITNFQKRITITRLKDVYSIFQQAIRLSEQDNGGIDAWDYTLDTDAWVEKYLIGYLKLSKNAKFYQQLNMWKLLDGSLLNWGSGEYTRPIYALHNGVWVSFYLNYYNDGNPQNFRKSGVWILVDINGNKGPNRMGRDVFVMSIYPYKYPDEKVVMGAHEQCGSGIIHRSMTREQLLNSGCATCKEDKTGWGFACSRLIQIDGWQISNEYPWIK